MRCLVNGHTVHVEEGSARPGESTPVVLLHGACNDHRVWLPLLPGLQQAGCAVYAPDLPGHGQSAGPLLTSVPEMADWLIAVLEACGLAQCALVGHSMGSLVALHAAALVPGSVTHLALVGTAWPMRVAPTLLELAQTQPSEAIHKMALWSHTQRDGLPLDPLAAAQTQALMESVQSGWGDGNLLATDLAACDEYGEGEAMAERVRGRTKVAFILGTNDRMTPLKAAARLEQALPEAGVNLLDCGHALMSEDTGGVLQALLRLLTKRARSPFLEAGEG